MTFRPRRRPSRIACCAVGGAETAGGAVRDRRDVARGPRVRHAHHAQMVVHDDPSALVDRQRAAGQRRRLHPRCPDQRVGRERLPVRQPDRALHRGFEPGVQQHVDVALRQLCLRVRREVRRKLGQDPAGRLDQDPPHLGRTQLRVIAHRVAGQVLQLPQRLHPGVSGSDEHERQRRATQLEILRLRGDIQPREDVVPQVDGLLHRREPDPVLGQTGDGEHARPGPRSHDEHVVLQLHGHAVRDPHLDVARIVVDRRDLADLDRGPLEQRTERHHDGARIDRAGGDLGQERLVLHEVLGRNQRDVMTGISETPHLHRGVHAGEPPAHDEDPFRRHRRISSASSAGGSSARS